MYPKRKEKSFWKTFQGLYRHHGVGEFYGCSTDNCLVAWFGLVKNRPMCGVAALTTVDISSFEAVGAHRSIFISWHLGSLITLIFVMLFTVNIEIKSHQSHHTLLSHATWTIWGNASSTQNLSFRVFRVELWKPVGGLPTYRFSWMQQGSFGQSNQLPVRI